MRKIDIGGPNGNVFYLIGRGKQWAEQLELDPKKFQEWMMSGDYNNALLTFNTYFSNVCTLTSDHELPGVDPEQYTIENNPYA